MIPKVEIITGYFGLSNMQLCSTAENVLANKSQNTYILYDFYKYSPLMTLHVSLTTEVHQSETDLEKHLTTKFQKIVKNQNICSLFTTC